MCRILGVSVICYILLKTNIKTQFITIESTTARQTGFSPQATLDEEFSNEAIMFQLLKFD